jgi:hypothetical protein
MENVGMKDRNMLTGFSSYFYYEFIFQTPISVDTNRVYIIYMDSSIFYL